MMALRGNEGGGVEWDEIRTEFGEQDESAGGGEDAYDEQEGRCAECDEAQGDEGEAELTGAHCFDPSGE